MLPLHLYVATIVIFLLWGGVFVGLGYWIYALIWKPTVEERIARNERARRIADRRG